VPKPTVAADADQPPDVLCHFAAQVTFHPVLGLDDSEHATQLFRRQIVRQLGWVKPSFGHDGRRTRGTYAVDVPEGILNALATRNINTQ